MLSGYTDAIRLYRCYQSVLMLSCYTDAIQMLSGCTDAIRLISPALHTVSLLLYALSGLSQCVMSTDFTPTQTGERVALERYVNENKTHLNKSVFNQISSVPDLRKRLKVVSVCKGWCVLGWGFGMV